jgi:hypothetical protein
MIKDLGFIFKKENTKPAREGGLAGFIYAHPI